MQTPVEISAKILLAEDDNDMRRFLVKALQNAGYAVASFDNGLSAYNRLREEPFELLLTDIVMPEMDGIELARRATELDPEIKVMFITGFAAVALNPDNHGAQGRPHPLQAVPSARPGERSPAAAPCRLTRRPVMRASRHRDRLWAPFRPTRRAAGAWPSQLQPWREFPRKLSEKQTQIKTSQMAFFCFLLLSFPFFYFSESGPFKGLRPKKIKKISSLSNSRGGLWLSQLVKQHGLSSPG